MTQTIFRMILMLAVLLVAVTVAWADDLYCPLAIGNTWTYTASNGVVETKEVTSESGGVFIITFTGFSGDSGLTNEWSTTPEGHVLLHGFWRPDVQFGVTYSPPIVVVDAPLTAGKSWTTSSTSIARPSGDILGSTVTTYTVEAEEVIDVAGVPLLSLAVSYVSTSPPIQKNGKSYKLDGRLLADGAAKTQPLSWRAPGVGETQYNMGALYTLMSYDLQLVSTDQRTWSAVKRTWR